MLRLVSNLFRLFRFFPLFRTLFIGVLISGFACQEVGAFVTNFKLLLRSVSNDNMSSAQVADKNLALTTDGRWKETEGVGWLLSGQGTNLPSAPFTLYVNRVLNFYQTEAWYYTTNGDNQIQTRLYYPYSNSLAVQVQGITDSKDATWKLLTWPDEYTNSSYYSSHVSGLFTSQTSLSYLVTLNPIPTGQYSVVFNSVRGYKSPAAAAVNITGAPYDWFSTNIYAAYSNSLSVSVIGYPAGNAIWTISGPADLTNVTGYPTSYTNNVTLSSVPTGTYSFNFPGVIGYMTPTNTIDISGATIANSITGTYVLAYPTNIPSGTGIQKFYQRSYFFTNVYLHDSGVPLHTRILNNIGPTGAVGAAATISIAWTSNSVPGGSVVVTNAGDSNNASLGFIIPTGLTGATGVTGNAATINVAWSSNGLPGTVAIVTNIGNSNAALFGFIIPKSSETGLTNWLYTNTYVKVETDSIATNLIFITSNAFVAADAVLRSELTNTITVASNHFESAKLNTNDPGYNNLITNTATKAQGTLADGAVQRTGDTNTINLTNASPVQIKNAINGNEAMTLGQGLSLMGSRGTIYLGSNLATFGISGETNRCLRVTGNPTAWSIISGNTAVGAYPFNFIDCERNITTVRYGNQTARVRLVRNGGSTASVKIKGYVINTNTPTRVEFAETSETIVLTTTVTPLDFLAEIPYLTNLAPDEVYMVSVKMVASTGNPILTLSGGSNTLSYVELPTPAPIDLGLRGAIGAVYPSGGTGTYNQVSRIITLPSITASQAGAASTQDFVNISNRVVRIEDSTNATIATQQLTNNMFSATIGSNTAFGVAQGLSNTMFSSTIGTATTFNASQILSNAMFSAWDGTNNTVANAAVKCAGDIMTGGLTNTSGFFGNGAGLTNLAAPSATNSDALGNIPAATWVGTTQALNTAVARIDANAITNPVGANVNFNGKNATNIGEIAGASLQVTGGNPTNGAVYICTNTATGQGKWSSPVGFNALLSGNFNFTNQDNRIISWGTEVFDYGNNFNGTTFIAPVNGLYHFTFFASWGVILGPITTIVRCDIKVNGTSVGTIYVERDASTVGTKLLDIGAYYLTNSAQVNCIVEGQGGSTNTLRTAECTRFTGVLIRELP